MRALRRPIAAFLLMWFLAACSTYQTTDLAPQEAVTGQQAVKVKLVDAGSMEVIVSEPWVRADSIGGVVGPDSSWAVPLQSVAEIRTKRANAALTAGAVVGGVVLAGGVAFAIWAAIFSATYSS